MGFFDKISQSVNVCHVYAFVRAAFVQQQHVTAIFVDLEKWKFDVLTDRSLSTQLTDVHLNPVKILHSLEHVMSDNSIIVADGGDFVGTAAYILRSVSHSAYILMSVSDSSYILRSDSHSTYILRSVSDSAYVLRSVSHSAYILMSVSDSGYILRSVNHSTYVLRSVSHSAYIPTSVSHSAYVLRSVSDSAYILRSVTGLHSNHRDSEFKRKTRWRKAAILNAIESLCLSSSLTEGADFATKRN